MSVTIVQPYCECESRDCLLREVASDGVCAVTLAITDSQWMALLKKYDHAIYVTSADCSKSVDPRFKLMEKCDSYWIYGLNQVASAPNLCNTQELLIPTAGLAHRMVADYPA